MNNNFGIMVTGGKVVFTTNVKAAAFRLAPFFGGMVVRHVFGEWVCQA